MKKTGAFLMLCGIMVLAIQGMANAAVPWEGNGYSSGACDTEADTPLDPGPGERAWHFVLNQTEPSDAPYKLYFGGNEPFVYGTPVGKGKTWHFYVLSAASASPTGTFADAPSGKLVISHCETGPAGSTTTAAPTTTTTQATTTTQPTTTTTQATTTTTVEVDGEITGPPGGAGTIPDETGASSDTVVTTDDPGPVELEELPTTGGAQIALTVIGAFLMALGFATYRLAR